MILMQHPMFFCLFFFLSGKLGAAPPSLLEFSIIFFFIFFEPFPKVLPSLTLSTEVLFLTPLPCLLNILA